MANTQNLHIACIVKCIRAYKKEINLAASSNVSFIKDHDYTRWNSFFEDLKTMNDSFYSRKMLDMPESHGTVSIDLGEPELLPERENQGSNMLCQYLGYLEDAYVNSASSRLSNGLIVFDYNRASEMLNAIDTEMAELQKKLPLDMPEVQPSMAGVGSGSRGLNPTGS
jgi:hypothetical protein